MSSVGLVQHQFERRLGVGSCGEKARCRVLWREGQVQGQVEGRLGAGSSGGRLG